MPTSPPHMSTRCLPDVYPMSTRCLPDVHPMFAQAAVFDNGDLVKMPDVSPTDGQGPLTPSTRGTDEQKATAEKRRNKVTNHEKSEARVKFSRQRGKTFTYYSSKKTERNVSFCNSLVLTIPRRRLPILLVSLSLVAPEYAARWKHQAHTHLRFAPTPLSCS